MNEENKSESLIPVNGITSMEEAISYRQKIYNEKTPKEYVRMKDKFPYLPSKYVDDTFKKYFPLYSKKLVNRSEDDYWIAYTVEITVYLGNGITLTEIGTGAARKQVSQEAKRRVLEGKGNITPFDYIDNGNASKAALTLAIKNAQERFGVGADVTDRLILSSDEIQEINEAIQSIIEHISNPRDKIKWKEALSKCDTPNQRLSLLNELREVFDVESILSEKEKNQ